MSSSTGLLRLAVCCTPQPGNTTCRARSPDDHTGAGWSSRAVVHTFCPDSCKGVKSIHLHNFPGLGQGWSLGWGLVGTVLSATNTGCRASLAKVSEIWSSPLVTVGTRVGTKMLDLRLQMGTKLGMKRESITNHIIQVFQLQPSAPLQMLSVLLWTELCTHKLHVLNLKPTKWWCSW